VIQFYHKRGLLIITSPQGKEGFMKILGVSVVYDEKQTVRFREKNKNAVPPDRLRRLRVYDVTNEDDIFRKYYPIYGSRLSVARLYIRMAIRYWLPRLRRNWRQS
jgi:hypothetical protein